MSVRAAQNKMFAAARTSADNSYAMSQRSNYFTSLFNMEPDKFGVATMLDHFQEAAMSADEPSSLWHHLDVLRPDQIEPLVKQAKELGRTWHMAFPDSDCKPPEGVDAIGFRSDLSSDHCPGDTGKPGKRNHITLIGNGLFMKGHGLIRRFVEEGLITYSLHKVFYYAGYVKGNAVYDALKHILAMEHGCDGLTISCSFGSPSKVTTGYDAILRAPFTSKKNVLVYAAAGNGGARSIDSVSTPARSQYVTAVGAHDINRERAPFSDIGRSLDVIAPGHKCYTRGQDGEWLSWSGTSEACPIAAAIGSILALIRPEVSTQKTMEKYLIDFAGDLGKPGRDIETGEGSIAMSNFIETDEGEVDDIAEEVGKVLIRMTDVVIQPVDAKEGRKLMRGQPAMIKSLFGEGEIIEK